MPKILMIRDGNTFIPIKKVAVYARISKSQKDTTGSVDSQISVLLDHIDCNKDLRLEGIYVDVGSGRDAESRKELKRLLKDCKEGRIDMILTKSVSRFGRNVVDMLSITRRLKEMNVDVFFLNDNIHSLDNDGELSLTLLAAVAEGESRSKSENIKWGIAKKAEDPDAPIYSKPCYGYRKDENGELVIHEKEAEIVRRIFDMYLKGMGSIAIGQALEKDKIPSPSGREKWPKATIEKMLRNEKYYGDVVLYKTYMEDYPNTRRKTNSGQHSKLVSESHHDGIISKEKFEEVQELIRKRSRKSK